MRLTSAKNPRIQDVVRLRQRRHRDQQHRFVIEGAVEVRRAVAAGVVPEVLFLRDGASFDLGEARDQVETFEVEPRAFERMAYRENPDGVLAVAPTFATGLDRLDRTPPGLWLVAVGIEKPGNLGAMLRTADAVGSAGMIVADGVTDVFNPNVVRASLGTVFNVPIAQCDGASAIRWFGHRATQVVATSPDAALDYDRVEYADDVAVLIGPEHDGLADEWLAGTTVRIPMAGVADSLNASVSAAIVLYEARRQARRATGYDDV